jgi:hypothetical protein
LRRANEGRSRKHEARNITIGTQFDNLTRS